MFNAHLFLKRKSPPGNPWIDDWKNNHVGFPCKHMHVSEIENQHSTVPTCTHIKTFYLKYFELHCDPSKPFLMQTQQPAHSFLLRKTLLDFPFVSYYLKWCYGSTRYLLYVIWSSSELFSFIQIVYLFFHVAQMPIISFQDLYCKILLIKHESLAVTMPYVLQLCCFGSNIFPWKLKLIKTSWFKHVKGRETDTVVAICLSVYFI